MNNSIIIIGSGWLGTALANSLAMEGYLVCATTTNEHKFSEHAANSLYRLVLLTSQQLNEAHETLNQHKPRTMIITIPPKRGDNNYLAQLTNLYQLAIESNVENILFISSSSVWGNQTGIVTEQTQMQPLSDSAKDMVAFEQMLLASGAINASVLKFAGLVGGERHPGRFLAGKTQLSNANAPTNMIHRDDCIGIISRIISGNHWQQSFIGCAPSHPTRQAFYSAAAKQLGLIEPQFTEFSGDDAKIIEGSTSAAQLNYQYQHPDLLVAMQPSEG